MRLLPFEYHSLVAQGPADSVIKSIADKAIFFTVVGRKCNEKMIKNLFK